MQPFANDDGVDKLCFHTLLERLSNMEILCEADKCLETPSAAASQDESRSLVAGAVSWSPSFLAYPLLVNTVFCTCSPRKQQRSWSEILHLRVCYQAIRPLLFHGLLLLLHISSKALELTLLEYCSYCCSHPSFSTTELIET